MLRKRSISTWTGIIVLFVAAMVRAETPAVTVEVEWKAVPKSTDTVSEPVNRSQASPIDFVMPPIVAPIAALPVAAPAQTPVPVLLKAPATDPVPPPPPAPSPTLPKAKATDPARAPCPAVSEAAAIPPSSQPARVWGSAEYLGWWLRGNSMPPLVTTAPTGTLGAAANPQTRELFGSQETGTEMMSGIRVRLGGWFDPCATCGIEGSFFDFPMSGQRFQAGSDGNPGLFRPFFNTSTGAPDSEVVALQLPKSAGGLDPVVSGLVSVNNSTDFYGFDANFRQRLCGDACSRLDLLVGWRYLYLHDQTSIEEDLISTDPLQIAAPLGTRIALLDQFQTTNAFNGGQIGLTGERTWGRWTAGFRATVALGDTYEQVKINGFTTISIPNSGTTTYRGGLLALPSNIGSYSSNAFAVVPEFEANLGYQIAPGVRIFGGYNFLYWSNVVRSGQQIDLVVNPTLLPNNGPASGPNRPAFERVQTDFWAQGFNVGIDLRW
jgi:hypothetical protein